MTVVVPAYREAGVIAAKIDDLRANGYPGSLDILVVADGDPETAAAAERAGARALTGPERLGKSQALNRGFAEATTPIVVISDANNRLAPGALAAVVEHFVDPAVGAVAGEKLEDDGGGGESLYWRFESWLKQREDHLGTTIGLVGELSGIRAEAWRPIPADVAIDDLWAALDIIEQGYRVAYEPRSRSFDPRVRVTGGGSGDAGPATCRRAARPRSTAAPTAPLGGSRCCRAVGAPPGPLHGEPAGARGPAGHLPGPRCVRASWPGCSCWPICWPPAWAWWLGTRVGEPDQGRSRRGATPRHLLAAASAGAGQVMFLQGVALGGMVRLCTRRPADHVVDCGAMNGTAARPDHGLRVLVVSTSPHVWGAERSLLGLAPPARRAWHCADPGVATGLWRGVVGAGPVARGVRRTRSTRVAGGRRRPPGGAGVGQRGGRHRPSARRLAQLARSVDVIHSNSLWAHLGLRPGGPAGPSTSRAGAPLSGCRGLGRLVLRTAMRLASSTVAVSRAVADTVGADRANLRVIAGRGPGAVSPWPPRGVLARPAE